MKKKRKPTWKSLTLVSLRASSVSISSVNVTRFVYFDICIHVKHIHLTSTIGLHVIVSLVKL